MLLAHASSASSPWIPVRQKCPFIRKARAFANSDHGSLLTILSLRRVQMMWIRICRISELEAHLFSDCRGLHSWPRDSSPPAGYPLNMINNPLLLLAVKKFDAGLGEPDLFFAPIGEPLIALCCGVNVFAVQILAPIGRGWGVPKQRQHAAPLDGVRHGDPRAFAECGEDIAQFDGRIKDLPRFDFPRLRKAHQPWHAGRTVEGHGLGSQRPDGRRLGGFQSPEILIVLDDCDLGAGQTTKEGLERFEHPAGVPHIAEHAGVVATVVRNNRAVVFFTAAAAGTELEIEDALGTTREGEEVGRAMQAGALEWLWRKPWSSRRPASPTRRISGYCTAIQFGFPPLGVARITC